ncbi:hypothetical protein, partial [Paraburkholderia sp. SIMBA_030]|uniref:hypothetical protein n=1 Tax=Paraburkholderia sp. SIMBA_030 TaxID=3085773 RepID=UPI00397B760A
ELVERRLRRYLLLKLSVLFQRGVDLALMSKQRFLIRRQNLLVFEVRNLLLELEQLLSFGADLFMRVELRRQRGLRLARRLQLTRRSVVCHGLRVRWLRVFVLALRVGDLNITLRSELRIKR